MVGSCVRSFAASAVPGFGASRPNFVKSLSFDPVVWMTRPGSGQSVISGRGARSLGFPFRKTRSTSRGNLRSHWSLSTLGEIGPHGNAHRREVDHVLTGLAIPRASSHERESDDR